MATTVTRLERTTTDTAATDALPECITRDRLTSPYFPSIRQSTLAVVASLAIVFFVTSLNRLNHTDLWAHVNFGRWIVDHGALPPFDPIVAHPSATPVLQSAWLSQLLAYVTHQTLGNEGLILAHALLVTLTALVMVLAVRARDPESKLLWVVPLVVMTLNLPIVGTIRPQLFGQLGAALVLLAAAQLMAGKKHPLFWLPIVSICWANLHGSMLMGLVMLGAIALGYTLQELAKNGWNLAAAAKASGVAPLWIAALLFVAFASIGPHGPMIWPHVIFFGESSALQSISEWQRLPLKSLTCFLLVSSALVAVAVSFKTPRPIAWYEILLLALFALATVMAIRMLAWWALVWPFAVVPHLSAIFSRSRATTPETTATDDQPVAMRTVYAMAIVFVTLLVSPPSSSLLRGAPRGEARSTVTDTPVYLADEVVRMNLQGNIAAPMDWGDYLLMRSDEKLRPLVATHVHLVSPDVWNDYQTIFRGDKNWLAVARGRDMKYLAVSKNSYPQLAREVLLADREGRGRILYHDQRLILIELPAKAAPAATAAG